LFGNEAQGAYEYDGKEYLGRNTHVPGFDTCLGCHNAHQLEVTVEECGACHTGVESKEDLAAIRLSPADYDGDGDTEEGIAAEVATMRDAVYQALQDNAAEVAGAEAIIYNPASYPYFFIDANGNGEVDEAEADRYNTWTPRLLQAAYNYQYANKDPGAYAHNGKYVLQILYDTLEDLGADVSGLTRPE
jgi:hypothetical protein